METEYTGINRNNTTWRYFLRQMFVCSTAILFFLMIGISLGTPTVAVPQLRREFNSTAAVSEEMASWITAITPYCAAFWIVGLITIAHHFGRKKTMIIIALNALSAFLTLYYSKNIQQLFISQLMQGMTQASYTTTSYMMALEYTSPKYRGLFLCFFNATYFWGMWIANAIGTFFNYRYIGLVGVVCSVYNLIALFCVPESPYWLACNERYDECAKVHRWLKGVDVETEKELNVLISSQKHAKKSVKKIKRTFVEYIRKYVNVLKDPQFHKPYYLNVIVALLYQFSGKLVCAVYAVEIMKKITETEREAYTGVLILDGFSVAGMYLGSYLAKIFKRRKMLICASLICAFFLYSLSIYLYLVHWSILPEVSYISMTLLVGFSLAACCGPVLVTSAIFAELCPLRYRSLFMCINCISSKICLGTFLKISPCVFEKFRVQGAFLFFAVGFSFFLFLVYKFIPETKDKTMHEISEMFKPKDKELQPMQNIT